VVTPQPPQKSHLTLYFLNVFRYSEDVRIYFFSSRPNSSELARKPGLNFLPLFLRSDFASRDDRNPNFLGVQKD